MSFVIGIAGGTGSGKTTIARAVAAALAPEHVATLEHDWYYRDRSDLSLEEKGQLNFDHPDSLETSLLVEHLRVLKSGRAVEVPGYDFKTHARTVETRRIEPKPVLIVEGILVFVEPALRELMNVKIFVDTDADIRLMRRVRRDIEQRGRTFQQIREQYYKTVRPMHLAFVEPSKRWADVLIPEGGNNSVALDLVTSRLREVIAQSASDAR
ncbi:MAG: uridine kinase [Deltaproteobacteria bacterium RBG_16_71_12]|nr:MAG: uridine kinase [Deltaproteobacteria bacterium RBG_16_71_12]